MTEGGNASFLIVKGHYSQAEKNIHITLGCFILFCFLKENQKTKQIEKKKTMVGQNYFSPSGNTCEATFSVFLNRESLCGVSLGPHRQYEFKETNTTSHQSSMTAETVPAIFHFTCITRV